MPAVESAKRTVPKATYVPLAVDVGAAQDAGGMAVAKFGYVRQLGLAAGEVNAVASSSSASRSKKPAFEPALLRTLKQFEGQSLPSQLPTPDVLAKIPLSRFSISAALSSRLGQQQARPHLPKRPAPPRQLPSQRAPTALNCCNVGSLP